MSRACGRPALDTKFTTTLYTSARALRHATARTRSYLFLATYSSIARYLLLLTFSPAGLVEHFSIAIVVLLAIISINYVSLVYERRTSQLAYIRTSACPVRALCNNKQQPADEKSDQQHCSTPGVQNPSLVRFHLRLRLGPPRPEQSQSHLQLRHAARQQPHGRHGGRGEQLVLRATARGSRRGRAGGGAGARAGVRTGRGGVRRGAGGGGDRARATERHARARVRPGDVLRQPLGAEQVAARARALVEGRGGRRLVRGGAARAHAGLPARWRRPRARPLLGAPHADADAACIPVTRAVQCSCATAGAARGVHDGRRRRASRAPPAATRAPLSRSPQTSTFPFSS